MKMRMSVPPPEGFATWLDYAVATLDTRSVEVERLYAEDDAVVPTRQQIQQAAKDELHALRKAAGLEDSRPPTRGANDGLIPLRWKPPEPPDIEPRREFPQDVARLVGVARDAGYGLSPADAERVWISYSEGLCAGWLVLGDDDEDLLRIILEHTAPLQPGDR